MKLTFGNVSDAKRSGAILIFQRLQVWINRISDIPANHLGTNILDLHFSQRCHQLGGNDPESHISTVESQLTPKIQRNIIDEHHGVRRSRNDVITHHQCIGIGQEAFRNLMFLAIVVIPVFRNVILIDDNGIVDLQAIGKLRIATTQHLRLDAAHHSIDETGNHKSKFFAAFLSSKEVAVPNPSRGVRRQFLALMIEIVEISVNDNSGRQHCHGLAFLNPQAVRVAIHAKEIKGRIGVKIRLILIVALIIVNHVHVAFAIKLHLILRIKRAINGTSDQNGDLREIIKTRGGVILGKHAQSVAKQTDPIGIQAAHIDACRLQGDIVKGIYAVLGDPDLVPSVFA